MNTLTTTQLADQWEENNWTVSVLSRALRDPIADELKQRTDLLRVVIPRLQVNGFRPLWITLLASMEPPDAPVGIGDGNVQRAAEAWLAWAYRQPAS